jgi:hypothetical protein
MDTSHERDILIPSRTLKEHDFTNLTADQAATSRLRKKRFGGPQRHSNRAL